MAGVTEVGDQQFDQEILKSEKPVLVDFWADWCVPCHMVSPVVEEIARVVGAKPKDAILRELDEHLTA